MEFVAYVEAVLAYIAKLFVEHWLVFGLLSLGSFMLGTLIFGRGYKRRIAALEVEVGKLGGAAPTVVNVNNYGGDPSVMQGLRDELDAKELELLDLRTLVGRLTPKPVPGTSATYVKLPEGTRIVTMDDGSIRMALPLRVSAAFEGGLRGELQGAIEKGDPPEGDER